MDHADLTRFVMHKIVWSMIFKSANDDGFAVKAELPRRHFPDNRVHTQIMDRLIHGGTIVSDRRYVPGAKCLGYKLGPELARRRHRLVTITDERLARKNRRQRAEFPTNLRGVYRHLYDRLRRVKIDRDAAIESLSVGDYDPAVETSIGFLHARQFHFVVCGYGRVHTNLTNLKSSLRQFLHVRGERLVNLDIRNSQPLIFASILKGRFEFNPDQTERPAPDDVMRYVELMQAGRFYNHLMEASGISADRRSTFDREFFGRVFFCQNRPVTTEAKMFGALSLFRHVRRFVRGPLAGLRNCQIVDYASHMWEGEGQFDPRPDPVGRMSGNPRSPRKRGKWT